MTGPRRLTDDEAYDLLHAAYLALGRDEGATARADTSLKAARRALRILQLGLLMAMEENGDRNKAVRPDRTDS